MLKRILERLGLVKFEPLSSKMISFDIPEIPSIEGMVNKERCDVNPKKEAIDFIKNGKVEQINYSRKKEDNYNKLYVEFEMECDDTTGRSTGEISLDGEKLASAIGKEKSN